jgi:phage recombination protein Bet
VVPREEKMMVEYVPFGADTKLKLTLALIKNTVAVKTRSGHTCSDNDAIKFMAMCSAKKLNPFEGDCYLLGYDGKDGPTFSLITAHQAFLKRAELHPEFDGMESGTIVRDQNAELQEHQGDFVDEGLDLVGGWARVYFKNRKHAMYRRLKLSRFNSGRSIWATDPAGMIVKCAEADALRSSFPTMLGGLFLNEEIEVETVKETKRPDFGGAATPLFAAPEPAKELPPVSSPASQKPDPFDVYEAEKEDGRQVQKPPVSEGFNPLKSVRNLCKMGAVKEVELLAWMEQTGLTDGSAGDLGEVKESVLRVVSEKWSEVAKEIKAARAGEGKGLL